MVFAVPFPWTCGLTRTAGRCAGAGDGQMRIAVSVKRRIRSTCVAIGCSFPTQRSSPPRDEKTQNPWTTLFPLSLRSEEHTSELQSRLHLVCRLLLEKKKI